MVERRKLEPTISAWIAPRLPRIRRLDSCYPKTKVPKSSGSTPTPSSPILPASHSAPPVSHRVPLAARIRRGTMTTKALPQGPSVWSRCSGLGKPHSFLRHLWCVDVGDLFFVELAAPNRIGPPVFCPGRGGENSLAASCSRCFQLVFMDTMMQMPSWHVPDFICRIMPGGCARQDISGL